MSRMIQLIIVYDKLASVRLSKHNWKTDTTKNNNIKEKPIVEFDFPCAVETCKYFPIWREGLNFGLVFEGLTVRFSNGWIQS